MYFYPEDYGATPGFGDSRPGIQAAIDACVADGGGVVFLSAGDWHLTRSPPGTYNHFASLHWHGAGVRLIGAGESETRLVLSGDAGASTFNCIQLDPPASDALLQGFTIDTTGLFNTDAGEQTHAIAIGSGNYTPANAAPVRNVVVQDVRFLHGNDSGRWGDAVRVAGNTEATAAVNVRLTNLTFNHVGRSAVMMQRNVRGLTIANCYFDADNIGGTPIDGEATGGEWDSGLVVSGCQFVRAVPGTDNYLISLTNQSDFAIVGNILQGRGISLVRSKRGTISGNIIDAECQAAVAAIDVANVAQDLVISNNTIRRHGAVGPAIKVVPHAGVFAQGLVVSGNSIANESGGTGILFIGVNDAVISGNRIDCVGANSVGFYADAGLRQVENLAISGCTFRGCTYAPILLASTTLHSFAGTTVTGCTSRASGPGVRCVNAQYVPAGGIVTSGNNWSAQPTYP